MKITIFGVGYVGLVTGACFAEMGNEVVCVDIDAERVARLNNGVIPIYEPGLEDLVIRGRKAGRLRFTTDAKAGVEHGLFQFIAVGTPPDENGSADVRHVLTVAGSIAEHMKEYKIIVDKSTVPVGTADRVRMRVQEVLARRGSKLVFDVVSNPEFLKEGAAVTDFMKPDRIVVGTDDPRTTELVRALYAPFTRNHDCLLTMDIRSAELTKYAANAMLATKISFMNELSHLAERLDADIEQVRLGIGSDARIGYSFIYPGCGYGGSCFPKDVQALIRTALGAGYEPHILQAVESVNTRQKGVLFAKIQEHFGQLDGLTVALWGLSFKPNTDDMREAPSRALMEALWQAGAAVRAHDPEAMNEAKRIYGERADLTLCDSPEQAADGAHALVILTEWHVFRSPDFAGLRERLKQPVIFDGRNLYDPAQLSSEGFYYYAVGRPVQVPASGAVPLTAVSAAG